MREETLNKLIKEALLARKQSYCPYSDFAVGAALLTKEGRLYTGANIENASFTPTVCAERVAFFNAVHSGERNFSAIAIVGGKCGEKIKAFCSPCGVCRQIMAEFCSPDFEIILFDGTNKRCFTLGELLPESFGKENIDNR
jgi:cytidine deaminase